MYSLTDKEVDFVRGRVIGAQVSFSHLADDLTDHICCLIEESISRGLSFEEAYSESSQLLDSKTLKDVEEKTLLVINKKYRIMKTTMKIFSLISLIMVSLGATFKIMHWPGAGILLLLGFTLLATVFYPSAIFVLKRENKIKWGGFIYNIALVAGIIFIVGVLFKIMHYPGAALLLLFGFLFFIGLLLPSLLFSKLSTSKSGIESAVYITGAIFLAITLAGECFKIMHYPGAAVLLFFGSMSLSLIWLPLYAIDSFRKTDSVKGGFIYLCTAMILFSVFNLLLALNVSKNVVYDYMQPGITSNNAVASFEDYNSKFANQILSDSLADSNMVANINTAVENSDKFCALIDFIKSDIIAISDGIDKLEAEKITDSYYQMLNPLENLKSEEYLFGVQGGRANELQAQVDSYCKTLQSLVENNKAENEFVYNLLTTYQQQEDYSGKPVSWAEYHFYRFPAIAILNSLSWLELRVRIAESSVLHHIALQSTNELSN
ncbi:MAG: hypothetical protein CVU11_10190 [Bacteroidetes bacterium HGW-Bacteroidetes-6]|jgi:hypothetical protein|nr:MAG: hypothetical protein CVU11_10190 [Bacteroidetes bacterium HGW-Bacteroidetes-6]